MENQKYVKKNNSNDKLDFLIGFIGFSWLFGILSSEKIFNFKPVTIIVSISLFVLLIFFLNSKGKKNLSAGIIAALVAILLFFGTCGMYQL